MDDLAKYAPEGVAAGVAGISSILTAVFGFFVKDKMKELSSKVSREDFNEQGAELTILKSSHQALVEAYRILDKNFAVMAAENGARDKKVDSIERLAVSIDSKLDALLQRTPPRGMPRVHTNT